MISLFPSHQFLSESDLMAMAGKLEELRVLTVAEVVRRGSDELQRLCGLKVGPKVRLDKALKRVAAAESGESTAAAAAPPVYMAPPVHAPPSAAVAAPPVSEFLSPDLAQVCV
jgi:hypothetical protein